MCLSERTTEEYLKEVAKNVTWPLTWMEIKHKPPLRVCVCVYNSTGNMVVDGFLSARHTGMVKGGLELMSAAMGVGLLSTPSPNLFPMLVQFLFNVAKRTRGWQQLPQWRQRPSSTSS